MWSLLKGMVFLCFASAFGYLVFFVPVGGQSVAEHAAEIWRSELVQDKVARVKEDVETGLAARLADAADKRARGALDEEIPDADRQKLEQLLSRLQ